MSTKPLSFFLIACLATVRFVHAFGQQPTVTPDENGRKPLQALIQQAANELNQFRASGGKAGDAADPALKWADFFWRCRLQHPGTPSADDATRAAIHLLQVANQDGRVLFLADRIPSSDPAWDQVISDMRASARKTHASERLIRKAKSLLGEVRDRRIRGSILLHMGRGYLDVNQPAEAERAFRAVEMESPGSDAAEQARAFLYELTNLAVGRMAPQFEQRTIDGVLIRSADLKGKVVLLNFWATW